MTDEIGTCGVTRMSLDLGLGLIGLEIAFSSRTRDPTYKEPESSNTVLTCRSNNRSLDNHKFLRGKDAKIPSKNDYHLVQWI